MNLDAIVQAVVAGRSADRLRARLAHAAEDSASRSAGASEFVALLQQIHGAPVYELPMLVAKRHEQIASLTSALSADDLSSLGRLLLPHIAGSVEDAWTTLAHRPYLPGVLRKPFRCPQSSEMLATARAHWLLNLVLMLGDYDTDIRWVARHAPALANWGAVTDLGWLLAGVIDAGGSDGGDVRAILESSAAGDPDAGPMGRHVTQALLSCSQPAAWDFTVKLLLAAQREEGLRQVILESVDEAHPQAFRRLLKVIRAENLARFSSTVRAFDVWFGFLWDGSSAIKVNDVIDRVALFLDDAGARTAAIDERDAETVYLALWSTAFDDVEAAVPLAIPLLSSAEAERRFVAAHFLVQTAWSTAMPLFVDLLADQDLRVVARALDGCTIDLTELVGSSRTFDALEGVMSRLPRRAQVLPAITWPWTSRKLDRSQVAAAMMANASAVPVERVFPYFRELSSYARSEFLREHTGVPSRWSAPVSPANRRPLTPQLRGLTLEALGDASPDVRRVAFEALSETPLLSDEIARLTDLLGRTAGDLRRQAIERLRTLRGTGLLTVADALLEDTSSDRRVAGLELLRDAVENEHDVEAARDRMRRYAQGRALSEAERAHVDVVFGGEQTATLDDALGLVDPLSLRQWPEPRDTAVALHTEAALACMESLAELVLKHQDVEVEAANGERKLLVEAGYWIWVQGRKGDGSGDAKTFPLEATWKEWLNGRGAAMRDADNLELVRALVADRHSPTWSGPLVRSVVGDAAWSAGERFLERLLEWCVFWQQPEHAAGFLLDGLESSLARLTNADFDVLRTRGSEGAIGYGVGKWPASVSKTAQGLIDPPDWDSHIRSHRAHSAATWTGASSARLYALLRWFQRRSEGFGALSLSLPVVVDGIREGLVDDSELIDLLVGPWSRQWGLALMRDVSGRKVLPDLAAYPWVQAAVDCCRRRILQVECQRGDRETAATRAALDLQWSGGLETLSLAVQALGSSKLARTTTWMSDGSQSETLSHLILRSTPQPADTHEAFAEWARAVRISETRLIGVASYAPQWAGHVNHVLGWDGLESGVWWLRAHTKDDRSWSLAEMKEIWKAEVSERTPLTADDLTEGAVDVEWFKDVFARLGPERWASLDAAAKYGASSGGHTRAQLFARAVAGLTSRDEITGRIDSARHQDSVRALGLLPLAAGEEGERDLLARYERLQTFRSEARRFGSQRQQSEKRAVEVGLANLARTAGYRDPQRLQWAMERKALGDLLKGAVVLEREGVTLTLSIDGDGEPSLTSSRAGKPLAAIPATLRRDPAIVDLKDRLQDLRRQRSRVRGALEEAMCRGDVFEASEIRALLDHPILAPALSRIVLLAGDTLAGYPVDGGRAIVRPDGTRHALEDGAALRIAHPHDLFASGDWSGWQRECVQTKRIQPFKQVFRELYPRTDAERASARSLRYAGHQINPRQGLSLLGARGWVAHPEQGVHRTFHAEGLTARLTFQQAFHTPAEVEGLTLEEVVFTKKAEWIPLPLGEVPPRVFSEAMRDLDLVVSVAHRGGVDPEASASTIEMRAALVRDICAVLSIATVEVTGHHAIVRGDLASYSVHLGSAQVRVLPGTALVIVAVHSQHRGRLFLPFADDDPRTAEVLSKIVLLARDRQIKDPNILDQIRTAVPRRKGATEVSRDAES